MFAQMKLKLIFTTLLLLSTLMSRAQDAVVAAGNEATGAGGSQSYTLGQVLYVWDGPVSGKIEGQGVQQPYINLWEGYTNTNWGLAANWLLNSVPSDGDNITFNLSPYNHLLLDQNRTVGNIVNSQSTYLTKLNGYTLTMTGQLDFTNGALLDASATGSTLSLAGTSAQSLYTANLYNQQVYKLNVNNANNAVLYGSLNLLNQLSATSGKLDAYTQTPTLVYAGSAAQTVDANVLLNERIYNLTSDNSAGLTVNTDLSVDHNVTVNSGKLLTVNAGKNLTVNGTLTNNAGTGGFVLASSAAGTASLMHNTDNVPGTAQRYIDGAASAWHFLSAPLSGQAIKGTDWTPSGSYGDGTGYDLYVWDEPTSCWVYNLNTTVTPTWPAVHQQANFVPGRGYLYAVQATTPTKQFAGNLNNGTVAYSVTTSASGVYKGFNFIGNPYPSSIDWKLDAGFDRSMLTPDGAGYDIWTWSDSSDNYGVYNSASASDDGTNNVSRYIASMQGFLVLAASAGTFNFYNAGRVHTGAGKWMKVKALYTDENIFRVTVNNNGMKGQDEVLMNFGFAQNENGALKVFSQVRTAPSLFLPWSNEKFSTRNMTDTKQDKQVPMSFAAGVDGNYTLTFSMPDTLRKVYLEDKLTGAFENIRLTGSYSFKAKTSDNASRFVIHFDDAAQTLEVPIQAYRSDNEIVVNASGIKGNYTIRIYDVIGRELMVYRETEGKILRMPVSPEKAVYVVSVTTETSRKDIKVL